MHLDISDRNRVGTISLTGVITCLNYRDCLSVELTETMGL